ncbi:MAG: HEAT repeat domain-containing protein [Pyrinomonadaceae bacterium]|nr:HEAT repeat domain-containing protein [Pyrinomonadaceae bacterium]
MDFATSSETLVWLAKWVGFISLVLVGLVSIHIIVLRYLLIRRNRREAALHEQWQPILVSCLDGEPENLPVLEERDITSFLVLWNYFHETLRLAGKDNLNAVAKKLELDEWALKALDDSIREKLLAIQTLGWLQEERGWDELLEIMRHASPVTSLCAAKAILRIDPHKGVPLFLELIPVRSHWSFSTVGKILKEAGADVVTKPLIEIASRHEGDELVRLLRFLDTAYEEEVAPLVSKLLRDSNDENVLMSCLRAVVDPLDLPMIRALLRHDSWRVRTQAAICLGELGTEEDIPRLVHAAGDQNWWVRFRSAHALAELPTMTVPRLKRIASEHQNFFGSDIISKVQKEREAFQ